MKTSINISLLSSVENKIVDRSKENDWSFVEKKIKAFDTYSQDMWSLILNTSVLVNNYRITKKLLDMDTPLVYYSISSKRNILHIATIHNYPKLLKMILSYDYVKKYILDTDTKEFMPLNYACEISLKLVLLLEKYGALHLVNSNKHNTFMNAMLSKDRSIIAHTHKKNIGIIHNANNHYGNAFHIAFNNFTDGKSDFALAKFIIHEYEPNGFSMDIANKTGHNILFISVINNNYDISKYLISEDAKQNYCKFI